MHQKEPRFVPPRPSPTTSPPSHPMQPRFWQLGALICPQNRDGGQQGGPTRGHSYNRCGLPVSKTHFHGAASPFFLNAKPPRDLLHPHPPRGTSHLSVPFSAAF